MQTTDHTTRYIQPGWFTKQIFNRLIRRLARMGISFLGTRELSVVGRSSGKMRRTVVNLHQHDGRRYLVAPRGTTQWVRNLRASGVGELRVGRRVESFRAVEIADADKAPVLRPYLERWSWEIGQFFDGVGPKATDEQLVRIGPDHPVFLIEAVR
jgi:deazaflavin-dependent oxidoreductase (nitroreductase family)